MLSVLIYGLGTLFVGLTALSWLRSTRWWIRFADFPRLQLAAALTLVGAAFLAFVDEPGPLGVLFGAAVLGALAFNLWCIAPYTPLAPREAMDALPEDPRRSLRLLIANVRMENRRSQDLLDHVRRQQPDVLLAVETDDWWNGQLAALDEDYPYRAAQPQENYYGMHLLSRLPLEDVELRFLVYEDVPSLRCRVRLRSDEIITFYGVHPRPPLPHHDSETRDAELLLVGREVEREGTAAIVAGDLNDVAWSHTTRLFQRVSGLLDPRRGRGFYNTFHADWPLLRWPLDHVFFDKRFALVSLACLPSIGSDHLPVLIELHYTPAVGALQEAPSADGEDRSEARERIALGLDAAT